MSDQLFYVSNEIIVNPFIKSENVNYKFSEGK